MDKEKAYPEVSHLRAMKYTDLDSNRTFDDDKGIPKKFSK